MSYSESFIPSARFLHDMAAAGGFIQPDVVLAASFLTTVAGAAAGGAFTGTMTVAGSPTAAIITFLELLAVQGYEARLVGTDIIVNW